jgi:hypothetical protein
MHALICSYICILLSPSSLVGRRSIVVLYHLFQHRSSSPPRSLAVRPHKPHLASLSATDMTLPNPILHYPANVPPVAALVAARICGVDLTEKPEKDWSSAASATLVFQDKAKLRGIPSILRYLARSSTTSSALYGSDPVASTMVSLTREGTRCKNTQRSSFLST